MQLMQIYEASQLAVSSIKAHKLRSFLTLLGVIFGVMTVVAVASVIEGANAYVSKTVIDEFGGNVVILDKYGVITGLDEWINAQKNKDITLDDYEDLRNKASLATNVGVYVQTSIDSLRVGNQELTNISIQGETASIANIITSGTTVDQGRFISENDDKYKRNVIFIGKGLQEQFFFGIDPIGKELRVKGQPFEIIGTAKAIGSAFGEPRDNFGVIPLQTHLKLFGQHQSLTLYFQASAPGKEEALQDQVKVIMRARHHISYEEKDDFAFITAEAVQDLWKNLTSIIAIVALAVTSISLVVGGIVIMNIMMVAVTERTREIGIRKSLGATRKDILWQFLIESSLLSSCGGITGLLVAWIAMFSASQIFSIPFLMPLWAIVMSLGVSLSVGLIFGIYPAYKASHLDPIQALRQE